MASDDGRWSCNFCGKQTKNQAAMFQHFAKKHDKESDVENESMNSDEDQEDHEVFECTDDDEIKIENDAGASTSGTAIILRIQRQVRSSSPEPSTSSRQNEKDDTLENYPEPPRLDGPMQSITEPSSPNEKFPGSISQVFFCELCEL